MQVFRLFLIASVFLSASCYAQVANQVELKIDGSNRTLTVSAEERVTAEPDVAILHIGFVTPPSDARQAYAAGSKISNQIVAALKQAGIPESSIRSESQELQSWDPKAHKYQVRQSWVVKVPPVRVAEILDIAVNAGATNSGQIEWTVEDEKALENQALEKASEKAKADAVVLAKGIGVQLGKLVYATNQIGGGRMPISYGEANFDSAPTSGAALTPPLAIEPHKVSRTASVYAVFEIE
ncbi:MAG TPA: SIMPL domain-containing protein [Terracidiphilus sp.]|jgi:hypothetical protein|nr:SIMPL domain-containing protein [Terracidiphilus sp.]